MSKSLNGNSINIININKNLNYNFFNKTHYIIHMNYDVTCVSYIYIYIYIYI